MLLDWKRSVHNHRPTKWKLADSLQAQSILKQDGRLGEEMLAWECEVESYHRSLQAGQKTLTSDWASVREGLASTWQYEFLQRGILYAHPELHRELENRPPFRRGLTKQDWRSEKRDLALLAFALRTSTKTSPFGTLTLTAVGRVSEDKKCFSVPDVRNCKSVPIISPHLIAKIARRWLTKVGVAIKAPLAAPELVHIEHGRIMFLTHSGANLGNEAGDEVVREVTSTAVAELILHQLRAAGQSHSHASLKCLMASTLKCEESRVSDFLGPLISAGLVHPVLAHDECRPNAAESLLTTALELDCPELKPECETMWSVVTRLRTIADAPIHEQAARLLATEEDIKQLVDAEATIPRGSVVFERCAVSETLLIPASAVSQVVPALGQLLNILPLFNVDLGAASVVQDFFQERCGPGQMLAILPSFAELWEHLQRRFQDSDRDAFQRSADEHEATAAIASERRKFVHELRDSMSGGSARCVEYPIEDLCRWAARAGSFASFRAPLSANFLGQFTTSGDADSFQFVLNSVAPGYGALNAGWATPLPTNPAGFELRANLVKALNALDTEGDVVEIATAMDFGGQIRDHLTTWFLSYPGSSHVAHKDRRIAWEDLGLFLDEKLGRVVLGYRRSRRRILPIHLGTISPRFFPPFYRFLLALGPCFTPSFSAIDFVEEEVPETERRSLRQYPRLSTGPLILSRQTWCVPSSDLPKLESPLLTFKEYLALRAWARDFDLPSQAFVTGAQAAEIVRDGSDVHALKRLRKPFFVDFDDYVSCVLLSRYTRRTGSTVRFVEALPWGANNPFHDENGPRVVEAAIELQGASRL